MHDQYKNLLPYVKCSYEQYPTVTLFQKVLDSMKMLKVSIEVDFGNLWIWQGLGL